MAKPRNVHEYRNAVLSAHGPGSALGRLVAVTVAQLMDGKTLESYHGAETIAQCAGLSERAVRLHLAALVRDGWLEERTKGRGRDFWLKVRSATIPDGHPASRAGSNGLSVGAARAGSRDPARDDGLPAADVGLPARGDTTPCRSALGHPAPRADDLVRRSCTDLVQDLGAAPPLPAAGAGSAAQEAERRLRVDKLLRALKSPEAIAAELGEPLEYVLARKQLREANPLVRRKVSE